MVNWPGWTPSATSRNFATVMLTACSFGSLGGVDPLPSLSGAVPAYELPDDDIALDVVGPLADYHQRRVAVVALDVELGRIPVAPVHPDRVGGDLQAGLGREQFRHPRLQVAAPPGVERGGRARGEQACRLHLGGHVGDPVADRLMPPDRLPERLPLL